MRQASANQITLGEFIAMSESPDETYAVVLRDDTPESVTAAVNQIHAWAADPELSLEWPDALVMRNKLLAAVRRETAER